MFSPRARISSKAEHDRLLQLRAVEEAGTLFLQLGVGEVHRLTAGLTDMTKTADERRYIRLMILEIERLDRERRRKPGSTALVIFKPSLFSRAGLARLFGVRTRSR
ncbi:MAG: hypothetical protein JWO65_2212 [Sphingomonas bacterium]|jgi:hypothetical protein|nr:hypothetical protein [Sphingomonas bacterium]